MMPEFYVLNEVGLGQDIKSPGDVNVFASRQALESHFEPWFVDEPHMLLTSAGCRMELRATKSGVQVVESSDRADYSQQVRAWLMHCLEAIAEAKARRKSAIEGTIDFESMSADDLCRLILLM
jgi:hypothetical protein